jgi:hypothetical protein
MRWHAKAVGGDQAAQYFHHATAESVNSGASILMFQITMEYGAFAAGGNQ